ncbi:MAG: hypothetical protein IJ060_13365 [Oscillospiraceae bacterium]|nr:hypothetical protein [Oscillospiraceae bacterium]MBQ8923120.1 hypothetical protein [Oscillospiraceae bacterium]
MKKTNKKSAKEKRVLIAALLVAAVTIAGSTFAWFTSKDEVTNRLTASADYGVSIVEDFTPPEDWLPGQKINKDVSAVNTGNVAAFVRLGLLYDSKLTTAGEGVAIADFAANVDNLVELGTEASTSEANTPTGGNTVNGTANEVTLLQAGGTLVIAAGQPVSPSDDWKVRSGDDSNTDDYSGDEQFTPTEEGLYIFQRTIYEEGTGAEKIKYSGYYYKGEKFYALETEPGTVYIAGIVTPAVEEDENGVVTLVDGALDDVKLASTQEVTIANDGDDPAYEIAWIKADGTEADAGSANAKFIRLTYVGNDNTSDDKALDDVIIDIELAEGWTTNWTYIANGGRIDSTNDTGFFYYNKILEPGATTPKLVDSVTLNKDVTQEAYKELTFDLSVILDSIQITPDENKTAPSYVEGVNGAEWGVTAEYDGTAVSWS